MNHSSMPMIDALQKHIQKDPVSFHVPGHKNGLLASWTDLSLDVTELTGLDDLHAPESCIKQAETLLADLYDAHESKFLVNGSTVGNLAMILGTISKGDTVLVQRNCHKSILNALKMAEASPVFLKPEMDDRTKTAVLMSADTLIQAFKAYPESKAVIFTYPTYYGMTGSFQELAAITRSHGALVLVDEAHGAHLSAQVIPQVKSALQMGADLVVQSAHKMLPAMTMGAFLHILSEDIDQERIHFYLQALQSSSPSYPIMASLDFARSYLALYSQVDYAYAMRVKRNIVQLLQSKELVCLSVDDPFKLLVRANGLTGFDLQALLEEKGVYAELADPYQVLLIFPLLKEGEASFEQKLAEKLFSFVLPDNRLAVSFLDVPPSDRVTVLSLPYNEHKQHQKEAVSFTEAVGSIAAEMIIPYPPGIPLVMEGECLSDAHIQAIQWLQEHGARFHGGRQLTEQKIVVFRKEN